MKHKVTCSPLYDLERNSLKEVGGLLTPQVWKRMLFYDLKRSLHSFVLQLEERPELQQTHVCWAFQERFAVNMHANNL
jgi:hypothetical protein